MHNRLPSARDLLYGMRNGVYSCVLLKAPVSHANSARTMRVILDDSNSAIVKTWSATSFNACLRALIGRRRGALEYHALMILQQKGIPAPQPIDRVFPFVADRTISEVVLLEDLGECVPLGSALHRAIKQDGEETVRRLSESVIPITRCMIECGFRDSDHRISNFLLAQSGRVYRIDLENAVVTSGRSHNKRIAETIGALVSSYAWFARPNPDWTRWFVQSLLEALSLSPRTLSAVQGSANRNIAAIECRTGLRVGFNL